MKILTVILTLFCISSHCIAEESAIQINNRNYEGKLKRIKIENQKKVDRILKENAPPQHLLNSIINQCLNDSDAKHGEIKEGTLKVIYNDQGFEYNEVNQLNGLKFYGWYWVKYIYKLNGENLWGEKIFSSSVSILHDILIFDSDKCGDGHYGGPYTIGYVIDLKDRSHKIINMNINQMEKLHNGVPFDEVFKNQGDSANKPKNF